MQRKHVNIMTAKGATGIGSVLDVEQYDRVILSFMTDGGSDAALTAKCAGSAQQAIPDMSASQSKTNMWDYIAMVDLNSGSQIQGDTGFVVATADDYRIFEVNVASIKYLTVRITTRTEGELTVDAWLVRNSA